MKPDADPHQSVSVAGRPIRKVLIANRGEIACRILRTLDRLGIASVAIYSDADSGALHVRRATEAVRIGPAAVSQSYLCAGRILEVAKSTGADAIHPGYGLLSESSEFAAACESSGISFLGPTAEQIAAFGRKEVARELARAAGVPICPGSGLVGSSTRAQAEAERIGFPLLLKAAAGGGGIGLRLCRDVSELSQLFDTVRRQAESHFGSGDVLLERFVEHARHIEVQLFGDGHGAVISLGLRDCSLQRRRQKVFEETPPAGLDPELCATMERTACDLARSVRYRSAGTVEFIVDPTTQAFYFLEVNTRLQVEHGVSELVAGIDLVEWMIRLAGGDAAFVSSYVHAPRGHAFEVRLYAEDPGLDFQPSSGPITEVVLPGRARVDTWIEPGSEVSPFYDPLLAKLLVHGESRARALDELSAALDETRLGGVPTNLEYARQVVRGRELREATHHTRSLDSFPYRETVLRVLHPGIATAVQEHPGRLGYWAVGVPPSGPMDSLAFQLANRIVGNRSGEAGLEMAMEGPTLRFTRDSIACMTGAEIEAELDGRAIPTWHALTIHAGQTLRLGRIVGDGARSYLAVRGGIAVPRYLESRATFTLGKFGGHCGRNLASGDVLPLGDPTDPLRVPDAPLSDAAAGCLRVSYAPTPDGPVAHGTDVELRVLDGPHGAPEFFTSEDLARFYSESYEVHHQSARTGVRLIGPAPRWARSDGGDAGLHPSNIHDTAYAVGSVDFTGDMPVILGPDGPSLGGFVCPAVVIEADLWKLGQLRAGARVRFRAVELDEALELARLQRRCIGERRPVAELASPPPTPRCVRRSGVIRREGARPGKPDVVYRRSGERRVLVEFGPLVLDLDLRARVQLFWQALRSRIDRNELRGIIDLTPGVRSLQVHFDPQELSWEDLLEELFALEAELPCSDSLQLPTRIVHLPLSWEDPATLEAIDKYRTVVREDAPWCPSNLEFIRRINGLESIDEVRRIVFAASYLVLGLGDVYLGAPVATPLDPRHRLVTTKYNPARTWTPENAVGIGGAYLCVYGMEGPGGYQLVGRTVPVWSSYERWTGAARGRPWLLRFFDQIRFFPVTAQELLEWRQAVQEGRAELRVEETELDLGAHHRALERERADIDAFRNRQRSAFEAERARWIVSGELDSAARFAREVSVTEPDEPLAVAHGSELITAAMGAQIWSVCVSDGQRVQEGESLVILAAMKTETAVVAPASGVVERVVCTAGQVVTPGAALVVLRADAS